MKYSILVMWNDRTEEYLKKGSEVAGFKNWEEADKMKEFCLCCKECQMRCRALILLKGSKMTNIGSRRKVGASAL